VSREIMSNVNFNYKNTLSLESEFKARLAWKVLLLFYLWVGFFLEFLRVYCGGVM
jgi:hypothetical protein